MRARKFHTPQIIASACLCGVPCRYDGQSHLVPELKNACKKSLVLPVCPEVLGGLSTPRMPCEISQEKVFSCMGEDVTHNFHLGAEIALQLALRWNVKLAILKENSPSCGVNFIYDGSFSKKLVQGRGVTANLLYEHGLLLLTENNYASNKNAQNLFLAAGITATP